MRIIVIILIALFSSQAYASNTTTLIDFLKKCEPRSFSNRLFEPLHPTIKTLCTEVFNVEDASQPYTMKEFNHSWTQSGGVEALTITTGPLKRSNAYSDVPLPISRVLPSSFTRHRSWFPPLFEKNFWGRYKKEKKLNQTFANALNKNVLETSYYFLNKCFTDKDDTTFLLKELISKAEFLKTGRPIFRDHTNNLMTVRVTGNYNIDDICLETKAQIEKNKREIIEAFKSKVTSTPRDLIVCSSLKTTLKFRNTHRETPYFSNKNMTRHLELIITSPLLGLMQTDAATFEDETDSYCKARYLQLSRAAVKKMNIGLSAFKIEENKNSLAEKENKTQDATNRLSVE